jgi:hypothetical protein
MWQMLKDKTKFKTHREEKNRTDHFKLRTIHLDITHPVVELEQLFVFLKMKSLKVTCNANK